jgi:hypothetical protein
VLERSDRVVVSHALVHDHLDDGAEGDECDDGDEHPDAEVLLGVSGRRDAPQTRVVRLGIVSRVGRTSASRWRAALMFAGAGVALLLVATLLHAAFLWAFADELPAPPASSLPDVPSSVQVVDEGEQCASGGCWQELSLLPAEGQSTRELAVQLGLDVERCEWVSVWDPRRVCVGSMAESEILFVYAANYSRAPGQP